MDELKKVIKILQEWITLKKVGSITINFFKGGISSIKIEETLKLK